MADIRPAIAQATAALWRSHNDAETRCTACDERSPCEASLMLADADIRLRRRLTSKPPTART